MEEHTVVVSGSGRRNKKRSSTDTFADMSGTGTSTGILPRRRFTSKIYIGLALGAVLVLAGIITWFLWFGMTANGRLVVDSNPPGAQVFINDEFKGGTPLPPLELPQSVVWVRRSRPA